MKKLFLVLMVLFTLSGTLQAQNNLPDSQRESQKSYVYTISKDNLRKVYLKDKNINEDMLGQYVAEFETNDSIIPHLPRGNYIIVNAVENKLNFIGHTVDDFHFKVIPSEKMMLCLHDSLGNMIENAIVKKGLKTINYNKTTQTYNARNVKDEAILEINNKGVYHYIEIEKKGYNYRAYKKNIFRTLSIKMRRWWRNTKDGVHYIFNPDDRPMKYKHTGFVVFSKPRYKPGDTVKFKAYLSEIKGGLYNKSIDIRLRGGRGTFYTDTILTHLKPYRPGMFEYEFQLTDNFNLKLDNYYFIELDTDNERYHTIRGGFTFEEYELKGINFSMHTEKNEYAAGDSVKIKFKVTDENEMAMYGGKIKLEVLPLSLTEILMNDNSAAFVADTLWTHTIYMDDKSEYEIVLPDSIFPKNISLHYQVKCEYLSADNEKQVDYKELFRRDSDYFIDFALKKGILSINELHKGQPQSVPAYIEVCGENGLLFSDSVVLPYTLTSPWMARDITVKTARAKEKFLFEELENQLEYLFYRQNDSIYLKVDNPAGIPFWYTIRKNKKVIAGGYTTELNYKRKDRNDAGYAMQLAYVYGKDIKQIDGQLPFSQKNISMEVSTPTTVYPGQKTDVLVSVTNRKGKPVNNVDITAYSYTSKFKRNSMPDVVVRGKSKYAKPIQTKLYKPDEDEISAKGKMSWERWKDTMSLDTIEYYKFLYPENFYSYSEPSVDGNTYISPYIVIDGALQGVNMLWIDGRLYYTNFAEQYDNYIFPVEPGNHTLRFRTYNRDVSIHNVTIKNRTRNILSFNVAEPYTSINIGGPKDLPLIIRSNEIPKKNTGKLTEDEIRTLKNQLILIDNNFGWVWLPNLLVPIDVSATINSGHSFYYLNPVSKRNYDSRIKEFVNSPIVAGPFPTRHSVNGLSDVAYVYADNKLVTPIEIEGWNRYTVYPDYVKVKSIPNWNFNYIRNFSPETNFHKLPLTTDFVEKHFDQRVLTLMSTSTGHAELRKLIEQDTEGSCRLGIFLEEDNTGKSIKPVLIFIVPEKEEEIAKYQLYYGATREFKQLPSGKVRVALVMGDSTSYSKTIHLKPRGKNYLKFDSSSIDNDKEIAETAFRIFNRNVKKELTRNRYQNTRVKDIIYNSSGEREETIIYSTPGNIVRGTVLDNEGEPLIGANVAIKGTPIGAITNFDGYFELFPGAVHGQLEITYLGYNSKSINYTIGNTYNITLEDEALYMSEAVVVAYGTQKRTAILASPTSPLQGNTAGVMIRGTGTIKGNPPLVILNGLPFTGNLESIDPNSIKSFNVLNDASATAIYGARAANGVIMIETDAFAVFKTEENAEGNELHTSEPSNSLRRNFHDDAFWQPKLTTNKKGEAKFRITYPDDITSWDSYFIAIKNKKKVDKKQINIRSFKALTARLSTPRFAVRGDSLNAVGRIANHYGDSISLSRKIEADTHREDKMRIFTSHVDYIPVKAEQGDSLTITYSLQMETGYFDGEQRSLPIMEQGMLQTHGEFKVINDSALHSFNLNPELGTATVYMDASGFELFLQEIEKVDRYPYLCNEQVASKIKVLLSKKWIAEMFNLEFKEDKKINNLISLLTKNRNSQGLWGWWNVSNTEVWISRHVISALLDAEKAGYKTNLDLTDLSYSLEHELKGALNKLDLVVPGNLYNAKKELLERLINLKRMNAPMDYVSTFRSIDNRLESHSITDKLTTMHTMVIIGLKDEINPDSLMRYANKTMLGSMYWGEKENVNPLHRHFMLPHGNNIDNTLMAYNILKEMGGYEDELSQIRNFFFEHRSTGSWRNTYESSRIIETIMPDMLSEGETYTQVTVRLNDKEISTFPYNTKIDSDSPIQIKKKGTAPLFATVYQENWNPNPTRETRKGFTVKSLFRENKDTVFYLTAGKPTKLEVSVTVDADAEYVQIEVPIPAGCSYESKPGYSWKEVHREHFKEKVVIFVNKLTKGEHLYTVELLPRYTGEYFLNPAKAELMYFPTFYGNEVMKKVGIK